jgi:hypothetical protein
MPSTKTRGAPRVGFLAPQALTALLGFRHGAAAAREKYAHSQAGWRTKNAIGQRQGGGRDAANPISLSTLRLGISPQPMSTERVLNKYTAQGDGPHGTEKTPSQRQKGECYADHQSDWFAGAACSPPGLSYTCDTAFDVSGRCWCRDTCASRSTPPAYLCPANLPWTRLHLGAGVLGLRRRHRLLLGSRHLGFTS